jgi:tetratricopeptide (TPR) repeat protein
MGTVACSFAYAALGLSIGILFYRSRPLRDDVRVQWIAIGLTLFCGAATLAAPEIQFLAPSDADQALASYPPAQGYVFLCAALLHVPTTVFVILSSWNRVLEHVLSPARKSSRLQRRRSAKDAWRLVEELSRRLGCDPLDAGARQELAETYLELGLIDAAVGQFRRAAECLERGYAQASILYKVSRLLAEVKGEADAAAPVLRRIIRLYPRSYFAGYARRVLNRHHALRTSWSPPLSIGRDRDDAGRADGVAGETPAEGG